MQLDLTLNVLLSARVVKPWQLQRVTVNIAQSEAGRLEHHTFLAARCPSLSAIIIDSVLNVVRPR
ncbi:MAG: uncharacterized protein KVP18_002535 [Porospora cf. gigantea A]|uniref:uncharacterized protein n=1 Tax=Porospora cf. gigantea A TaxID=2853593 RepID=UPI0035595FE7|nr:MAG: hypothetical protein KVP18_002535 [Porospora cf. gigantea A]